MYWNEKIDLVKKQFPAPQFKDPYQSGIQVIEKIIRNLFQTTRFHFSASENRVELLKDAALIKTCTTKQLYDVEIPLITKSKNFWVLIINPPRGQILQVYDCQYEPMRYLLQISSGTDKQEFCIVEKKYAGMLFYAIDHVQNTAAIYKTGKIDGLLEK